jgi:hypothetical protein
LFKRTQPALKDEIIGKTKCKTKKRGSRLKKRVLDDVKSSKLEMKKGKCEVNLVEMSQKPKKVERF